MTKRLTARQQLQNFPADLEMSLNARLGKAMSCDNVILCGMGGSAISNSIVYDCLYHKTKFVKVVRSPIIPAWANDKTLAVISSYSGNTAETVEMYHNALKQKCKIVVISSGGKLMELAEKNGNVAYALPVGMDPRHAIGYMAGFIFGISRDVGGADVTEKLHNIIPVLKRYTARMELTFGPAKAIARSLMNSSVVIYYTKDVESIALRWKSQIAENAKYVAIAEQIEFFSVRSYKETIRGKPAIIVISTDTKKNKEVRRMAFADNLYYKEIKVGGTKYIENHMKAIILGDYVSVNMGEYGKVDIRDVAPITRHKAIMTKKLKEMSLGKKEV